MPTKKVAAGNAIFHHPMFNLVIYTYIYIYICNIHQTFSQILSYPSIQKSKPTKDCHLCDWIAHCDPTWGARELWEQESRNRLLLGVAFCTGWLPKDTKISRLDSVVSAFYFFSPFPAFVSNYYLNIFWYYNSFGSYSAISLTPAGKTSRRYWTRLLHSTHAGAGPWRLLDGVHRKWLATCDGSFSCTNMVRSRNPRLVALDGNCRRLALLCLLFCFLYLFVWHL